MPLIKCPDCGKEISSRARACPFCGCPSEYFAEAVIESADSVLREDETIDEGIVSPEVVFKEESNHISEHENSTEDVSAKEDVKTCEEDAQSGDTPAVFTCTTPIDQMIRERNASDNKYKFKLADHILEFEEGDYEWIDIYRKLWKVFDEPYIAYRKKLDNYDIKTRISNMTADNQALIDSWLNGAVNVLNETLRTNYTEKDVKQAEPDTFIYEPNGNAINAMACLDMMKGQEKMVRGMRAAKFLTFKKDDRKAVNGELRGYQRGVEEAEQEAEKSAKEVAFDILEYVDKIVDFITETIEENKSDIGTVNTDAFYETIEELQSGVYEDNIYNGFYIYLAEMGSIYQIFGARYLLDSYLTNGATFDEAREIVAFFNRYQYDRWAYDQLEEWLKNACRGLISKENRFKNLLELAYKADVIESDYKLVNLYPHCRERDICFTKLIDADVIKDKPYNSIEEWIRMRAPINGGPVLKELKDYCDKYHLLEEGAGLELKAEYAKCRGISNWFATIKQACQEAGLNTEIPAAVANSTARFCSNCGAAISESAKFCPSCGQPVQGVNGKTDTSTIDSNIQSLIASGDKVGAMRAYIKKTGGSYMEAKDFIDKFMK